MFVVMRKRHEENLGAFAPPSMTLSLSSCQDDMKNLLEEISLQHHKKVESLDFITRSFASIFGSGAYQGEEKELHALAEKAKIVVDFAQDYELVPQSKKYTSYNSQDTGHGTLDPNVGGSFSGNGRIQITDGTVKCSPEDIDFMGDKMYAKPQSHEISFLVHQFVKFSNVLNTLLGFQTMVNNEGSGQNGPYHVHFRINLRFLADYRNLLAFFPLLIWLCRIILS